MGEMSAAQAMKQRVGNEVRFILRITPPGEEDLHEIAVDLRSMSLSERQLAKRAMAKFTDPDAQEWTLVHAWVVWRRTHETASLQAWMDDIRFGDLLDGLDLDPGRVAWDTTPEGFDPEA